MSNASACVIALTLILSLNVGCTPKTTETDDSESAGATPQETSTGDNDSFQSESDETTTLEEATPIVIDVRSQGEWDSGHVEVAVNIPHTEIGERISEVTTNKDAKIVLYCKSGGRAGMAKTTLEELGFKNVENAGGYEDIKSEYSKDASEE